MSKNKYLGTVSAVALLFMLLSLRLYYAALVWSDIFWIITGVFAIAAGGFAGPGGGPSAGRGAEDEGFRDILGDGDDRPLLLAGPEELAGEL